MDIFNSTIDLRITIENATTIGEADLYVGLLNKEIYKKEFLGCFLIRIK